MLDLCGYNFTIEEFISEAEQTVESLQKYLLGLKEDSSYKTNELERNFNGYKKYIEFLISNTEDENLIKAHIPYVISENKKILNIMSSLIENL